MNHDVPLPKVAFLSRPWLAGRARAKYVYAVVEIVLLDRTPCGWRYREATSPHTHFLQDKTADSRIFANRGDAEDWVTARLDARVEAAHEVLVNRRLDLEGWKRHIGDVKP